MVNIEISEDGDFSERRVGKNVLHFRVEIVKEFYIVSKIRREINSTDILSSRMTIKS